MNFRTKIFAANRFGLLFAGLAICSAVSFAQAPAPQPAANFPAGKLRLRASGSRMESKIDCLHQGFQFKKFQPAGI